MTTDKKTAPSEWWISEAHELPPPVPKVDKDVDDLICTWEPSEGLRKNWVHVIEHSAYALKVAELEDAKEHASDAKALREQRGIDMKKITALEAQLKEANEKNSNMNYKFAAVKDGVDVIANDNEELKDKLALRDLQIQNMYKIIKQVNEFFGENYVESLVILENSLRKELEEIKA